MKKPLLIEITILTVVFALLFCGLFFGYSKIFVEPNTYNIEFIDIGGITKGSPVRFMGMNVGYVRKLKTKDKYINVQILITKKNMKIPNGTVARVEFYGLGGSKSIELMPPDGSCDVGIITANTIRIGDVAKELSGLVDIIEIIEQYVKSINKDKAVFLINTMNKVHNDNLNNMQDEFAEMQKIIFNKAESIKNKQKETSSKIKNMNNNLERINKFIKK